MRATTDRVGRVVFAGLLPHAPILVPGIGGGRQAAARRTTEAMGRLCGELVAREPEVVIVLSPHFPRRGRAVGFWMGRRVRGSLEAFGAPEIGVDLPGDRRLAEDLEAAVEARGLGVHEMEGVGVDHGAVVPLWFVAEAGWSGATLVLGVGGQTQAELATLGECLKERAESWGRRVAVVASGDMSHRMSPLAPIGYSPAGPAFDRELIEHLRRGEYRGLARLGLVLVEEAAEDVVETVLVAASAAGWRADGHEVLSYEGPFGVGYGVAVLFRVEAGTGGRRTEEGGRRTEDGVAMAEGDRKTGGGSRTEDGGRTTEDGGLAEGDRRRRTEDGVCGFVELPLVARRSVETGFEGGAEAEFPESSESGGERAGVFVTIRGEEGELRGCVGTLTPQWGSVVEETWRMARRAAFEDGRFAPVRREELSGLTFEVSVLGGLEAVADPGALDPARYGVVVSAADGRRGVLLPGIEGVETVAEQVTIARRKGGIAAWEPVTLERFEVRKIVEEKVDHAK